MTDERSRAGRSAVGEPDWLHHLREAIDGKVLLDIRIAEFEVEGECAFDFLIVHRKGRRSEAGALFSEALLRSKDIPPHIVMSADEERAERPWYGHYTSVKQ